MAWRGRWTRRTRDFAPETWHSANRARREKTRVSPGKRTLSPPTRPMHPSCLDIELHGENKASASNRILIGPANTAPSMMSRVVLQLVALSVLPSHEAFTVAPLATPPSLHAAGARPLTAAARLRGAASIVRMQDEETARPHPHPHLPPQPQPQPHQRPYADPVPSPTGIRWAAGCRRPRTRRRCPRPRRRRIACTPAWATSSLM